MTCTKINNGFICNFTEYENYICFEHTTYLFTFSRRFGPAWFRIECGREIQIEFEFDDNNEVISNKFLWTIFEEWYYMKEIK